jgi:hypothetical protein
VTTVTSLRAGRYDSGTVRLYWSYNSVPIPIGMTVNIYGSNTAGATWSLLDSTTGDQWQTWDVTASDTYTWGFSLTTVDAGVESAPCAVVGLSPLCIKDVRYGGTWSTVGKSLFGGYPVWAKNPPTEVTFGGTSLTAQFTKSLGSFTSGDYPVTLILDVFNARRCGSFATYFDPPPDSGLPGGFYPVEEELVSSTLFFIPIGTFVTPLTTVTIPEPLGRWVIRGAWEDAGFGFDQVPLASTVLYLTDTICSIVLLGWPVPTLPLIVRRAQARAQVIG